jgi:hypothetical protein
MMRRIRSGGVIKRQVFQSIQGIMKSKKLRKRRLEGVRTYS